VVIGIALAWITSRTDNAGGLVFRERFVMPYTVAVHRRDRLDACGHPSIGFINNFVNDGSASTNRRSTSTASAGWCWWMALYYAPIVVLLVAGARARWTRRSRRHPINAQRAARHRAFAGDAADDGAGDRAPRRMVFLNARAFGIPP